MVVSVKSTLYLLSFFPYFILSLPPSCAQITTPDILLVAVCRNPINGVKELKPPPPPPPEPSSEEEEEEEEEVVRKPLRELTPKDAAYWAEGFGKGGEKPWKFKCICGEQCSSYENYRYHPVGRMYECTVCHIWSHVDCVLGPKVTDDDLEEMDDSMCNTCLTKAKRAQRHGGTYVPSYVYTAENLSRGAVKEDEVDGSAAAPATTTSTAAAASSSSALKKKEEVVKAIVINAPSSAIKQISSESEEAWRFKCICGEVCSSYENPLYHPRGRRYACTMCKTQCHVNCMFGNKITDEEIRGMTVSTICMLIDLMFKFNIFFLLYRISYVILVKPNLEDRVVLQILVIWRYWMS